MNNCCLYILINQHWCCLKNLSFSNLSLIYEYIQYVYMLRWALNKPRGTLKSFFFFCLFETKKESKENARTTRLAEEGRLSQEKKIFLFFLCSASINASNYMNSLFFKTKNIFISKEKDGHRPNKMKEKKKNKKRISMSRPKRASQPHGLAFAPTKNVQRRLLSY